MLRTMAFSAVLVIWCLPVLAAGQADAKDPAATLKEINQWYSDQLKQARDSGRQADIQAILKERVAKSKAAVQGVDPNTVDVAKSLAWAQLFQAAQMPKEMLAAATRFVASNPEPGSKYQAQNLMLTGLQQNQDAAGLQKLVGEMRPPNASMAASLASMTARVYASTVAGKLGVEAGLALVKSTEAQVSFDQLTSERDKQLAESTIASIALGRSALLEQAGQITEALAALEEGRKKLPPDSRFGKSLESKLMLARLPGSMAPELKFDRKYGEFSSIAALRGKVVVLDFTAHW